MDTKQFLIQGKDIEWTKGSSILRENALYEGREIVYFKIFYDKRNEGKGIAYMVKFVPPTGKMIKIVAKARSEENVYIINGSMRNKRGEIMMSPGDFALNETGHLHSQFVIDETIALVVCSGDIDEQLDFVVVEAEKKFIKNNNIYNYFDFIKKNIGILITLSSIFGIALLFLYFKHIQYIPISLNLVPIGLIAFIEFLTFISITILLIFYPTWLFRIFKEERPKSKSKLILNYMLLGTLFLIYLIPLILIGVYTWLIKDNNPNFYYLLTFLGFILFYIIITFIGEHKLKIKKELAENLLFLSFSLLFILIFICHPIFMNLLKSNMDSIGLRYEKVSLYLPYKSFNNMYGYSRYQKTNYVKIPNTKILFRGDKHMLIVIPIKNHKNIHKKILIQSNGVKIAQNYTLNKRPYGLQNIRKRAGNAAF